MVTLSRMKVGVAVRRGSRRGLVLPDVESAGVRQSEHDPALHSSNGLATGGLRADEDELLAAVRSRVARPMPHEVQACLAPLLDQRRRLSAGGHPGLLVEVDTALLALLGPTPNVTLAQALVKSAARASRRRFRVLPLVTGLSLGLALFSVAFHLLFAWWGPRQGFFGFDSAAQRDIAMVTLIGALGATVSMMLRAWDYAAVRRIDSEALLYTAFFKPVVGASFALFIFLTLRAGIIEFSTDTQSQRFLVAALAFIAGFSERFAKDVISRVASSVAEGTAPTSPGTTSAGEESTVAVRASTLRASVSQGRRARSSAGSTQRASIR